MVGKLIEELISTCNNNKEQMKGSLFKQLVYLTEQIKSEVNKPTLEDYLCKLPRLEVRDKVIQVTDDDWAYIPMLYYFEDKWAVSWIHDEDNDSLQDSTGDTPMEAVKNAYY